MDKHVERDFRVALGLPSDAPMPPEAIALYDQYVTVARRCGVQGPDLRALISMAVTVERQQGGKKK
jgi:hypothetical protein